MKNRTWVATLEDGTQILVNYWSDDDTVTIAQRTDKWATWSRPTTTEDHTWVDAS